MLGRISVLNASTWSASSSRSWTISKGMRASTSAWYQPRTWSSTFVPAFGPPMEPGGLLRVDQADAGQRGLVAQVVLDAVVPAVEVLDDASASAGRGSCRRTW